MRALPLPLLLALAACSGGQSAGQNAAAPQDLESAAIERGLVHDPEDSDTDRICIVRRGDEYRIGAFVDYGERITCSASGKVTRAGETLRVAFDGGDKEREGCGFDARFDGDTIRFPGNVPDACSKLCAQRASWAGLEVERLSESGAEAAALRDPVGKPLCG